MLTKKSQSRRTLRSLPYLPRTSTGSLVLRDGTPGSKALRVSRREVSRECMRANGIPHTNMSLLQMLLLWFSANLTINNLAVTLTGPLLFSLGFVDCVLCAIFGITLGALSTAYMATWGAVSGNRTMVCSEVILPIRHSSNGLLRS
jgi:hypothetical protein